MSAALSIESMKSYRSSAEHSVSERRYERRCTMGLTDDYYVERPGDNDVSEYCRCARGATYIALSKSLVTAYVVLSARLEPTERLRDWSRLDVCTHLKQFDVCTNLIALSPSF